MFCFPNLIFIALYPSSIYLLALETNFSFEKFRSILPTYAFTDVLNPPNKFHNGILSLLHFKSHNAESMADIEKLIGAPLPA